MKRLENKVAIVTGGASGIGKAIAKGMAYEGAKVCIADLSEEKSSQVATEIGHDAIGLALDVSNISSITGGQGH
ncbi:MAG: SDR family NAD(P)-dependent oxidoreductase [Halieaceae bacterium]|nr:SDR family NAD(P)-dependent oxidoreductase [Halieaceae bacterium]